MELFTKLGIDWRLLIAQFINFAVILLVLNHFLYKPLLGMLKKREEQVKKNIDDAQKLEEEMEQMDKDKEESLRLTRLEANEIISNAKGIAEDEKQEIVDTAQKQAEEIIKRARIKTEQLSDQARLEIKDELAHIVIEATEKVLSKKITKKSDQELIKQAIESLI